MNKEEIRTDIEETMNDISNNELKILKLQADTKAKELRLNALFISLRYESNYNED